MIKRMTTAATMGMWSELFRTNDLDEALTIVTSIAAMEFDVRWLSRDDNAPPVRQVNSPRTQRISCRDCHRDESPFGGPPYVIEVAPDQWRDLRDVLDTLREEQWEFDRCVETGRVSRDRVLVGITVVLSAAPLVMGLIDLMDGP